MHSAYTKTWIETGTDEVTEKFVISLSEVEYNMDNCDLK